MLDYMAIFAAALVLAAIATPIARVVATRTGVVDKPNARKVHQKAIPLLGGVAIYLSSIIAVIVFGDRLSLHRGLVTVIEPQLITILAGATLVSSFGIWDDRWGMRPLLKLGGQAAAAVVLIISGVQVEFLHNPVLDIAATILWIVGITNAMNLLDNMDGLSSGIATIAAAFFFLLAAGSGQVLVSMLAIGLMGACLGFLRYNFRPASIFMGDTGSLFLGYILATVGIKLRFDQTDIVTWMIPLLVLGVPIFDTTLVVVSRLRRGLNPLTTPGKDHISHRLVSLGWTQREAVMALYLSCGGLGMLAMFLTKATVFEGYLVGGAVVLFAVILLVKLEQIFYLTARKPVPAENEAEKTILAVNQPES